MNDKLDTAISLLKDHYRETDNYFYYYYTKERLSKKLTEIEDTIFFLESLKDSSSER